MKGEVAYDLLSLCRQKFFVVILLQVTPHFKGSLLLFFTYSPAGMLLTSHLAVLA